MGFELIKEDLEFYISEAGILEHSENVEQYSLIIFDNLEHTPDYSCMLSSREVVGLCGRYHDIGKYFFDKTYPDLLNKESFDVYDRNAVKQHTLMGQLLLMLSANRNGQRIDELLLKTLMDAMYYHHERIDGTGYYKRRGDAIPFIAQLVAVADHYSAGTEYRIYNRTKSAEEVFKELQEDKGLNKECVHALQRGVR